MRSHEAPSSGPVIEDFYRQVLVPSFPADALISLDEVQEIADGDYPRLGQIKKRPDLDCRGSHPENMNAVITSLPTRRKPVAILALGCRCRRFPCRR